MVAVFKGRGEDVVEQRILVWGLSNNRAGTEAVISNYSGALPELSFDYLCYGYPSNYEHLLANGRNRFFTLPIKIKDPVRYSIELKRFMASHSGEYSALWFNINDVSNIDLLRLAGRAGIERRIVHMHNGGMPNRLVTQVFSRINWSSCLRLATDRWACSGVAGDFLFKGLDYVVVPNMVNPEKVSFSPAKRRQVRAELKIEESFVIGSIGRLEEQKNYLFLVDVLKALVDKGKDAVLLLVGEGSQREKIEARALALGVSNRLVFAGVQDDVQAYYSAFDVAAYPSLYEGLSLAIVEAQFNGLPCILSSTISPETIVSKAVRQVPLGDSGEWANALLDSKRKNQRLVESKANVFDIRGIRARAERLFVV